VKSTNPQKLYMGFRQLFFLVILIKFERIHFRES